jgi:hypothetical protein
LYISAISDAEWCVSGQSLHFCDVRAAIAIHPIETKFQRFGFGQSPERDGLPELRNVKDITDRQIEA